MGNLSTPQGLLQAPHRVYLLPALKVGKLGCSCALKWLKEEAVIFQAVRVSHLPQKSASLQALIARSKYLNTMH